MSERLTGVGWEALKRRKEGKIKRRDSEVQQMRYGTVRRERGRHSSRDRRHNTGSRSDTRCIKIKIGY